MSVSHVSTHVLDAAAGRPAAGMAVVLEAVVATGVERLGAGTTDVDGRLAGLGPERLPAGRYRLTFDTGAYFAAHGVEAFHPEVTVTFVVAADSRHDHVPLLLSPFSYTTYRGS